MLMDMKKKKKRNQEDRDIAIFITIHEGLLDY
jgi:hypothetical protein